MARAASGRGPFLPKGLRLKEQLPYYSGQFLTTELNGVFYRTPTPEAVTGWRDNAKSKYGKQRFKSVNQ